SVARLRNTPTINALFFFVIKSPRGLSEYFVILRQINVAISQADRPRVRILYASYQRLQALRQRKVGRSNRSGDAYQIDVNRVKSTFQLPQAFGHVSNL